MCLTHEFSLPTDNPLCHIHQINGGVEQATVTGNAVTLLFEPSGPTALIVTREFEFGIEVETGGNFEEFLRLPCGGSESGFTVTCFLDPGKIQAIVNICECFAL